MVSTCALEGQVICLEALGEHLRQSFPQRYIPPFVTLVVRPKIIVVFPPATKRTWFDAAMAAAASNPPVAIVGIGVGVPEDLQEALAAKGGRTSSVGGPTLRRNGQVEIPQELDDLCETYPGKPAQIPCRPILNVFPDAARTQWEEGDEAPHHQVGRDSWIPNEDIPRELICHRLNEARRRYLDPDSRCTSTLEAVYVEWRDPPNPLSRSNRLECWDAFCNALDAAKRRGVQVMVRGANL